MGIIALCIYIGNYQGECLWLPASGWHICYSSLNLRHRIVLSIFVQIFFLVVFSFSLVIYMCTYLFVLI